MRKKMSWPQISKQATATEDGLVSHSAQTQAVPSSVLFPYFPISEFANGLVLLTKGRTGKTEWKGPKAI